MRRYIESIVNLGYPRVELPGGRPHYPKITMGDARGARLEGAPPYAFQHAIVDGVLPIGRGGETFWIAANMNGRDHENNKVDKMLAPHWFEIAHARWPDGHFDYFLAQMRGPGERSYTPSLFWGLSPIDPRIVKPPPAPSYLARERVFAMLRAEERSAYWESASPAVAFQLSGYYVHYAHDCFSLLGFYAFNRPIYLNRQISNGYGGGCPWTDSTRGHAGVIVDNQQFMLDTSDSKRDHPHWPNPVGEVPTRVGFDPLVKFIAARARPLSGTVNLDNRQPLAGGTLSLELRKEEKEVWPGVDMTRALFLTREYLCDVFQLVSDRPRRYDWHVHALGLPVLDSSWKPTAELRDALYDLDNRAIAARLSDPVERDRYQLRDVMKLDAGERPWTATVVQSCALPDARKSVLGNAWYDRKIGVCVRMLGEKDTSVYVARTPESRRVGGKEPNKGEKSELPNEVGGTTLLVQRRKPATVFAALHEPVEKAGAPACGSRVAVFRRIAENSQGIGMAVQGTDGSAINDRILFRFWEDHDQPLTLAGDGESFTFADRAFLRIGKEKVEVSGDLRGMRLKVSGKPALWVNGRQMPCRWEDGYLVFDVKNSTNHQPL
jgi:hypothetical protein